MRRRASSFPLLSLALVGVLGCKRGDGPATPPTSTTAASDDAGATASDTTPPDATSAVCPTPYTGAAASCTYEVDGCCYPDAEQACAAAACAADRCEILETYPAQVRCRDA